MSTNKQANRLIHEKSPYLLQHAYNPVNWYSWGNEAFEKAKNENKPIFLSIGYSTCHWCHVMENESFEDGEVADYLNQHYVAIKVDKEERPDIDSIYMSVCQSLTGSGGWPLTIFMLPNQKPFYAGTYFPKKSRYQIPGIMTLLQAIHDKWENDPEELIKAGESITDALGQANEETPLEDSVTKDLVHRGAKSLINYFDKEYGGFGRAPKFPTPHNLMFLMRYSYYEQRQDIMPLVEKTLDSMYQGGIFDHIGYGFSRYSTDQKWLVPHFEKMLYDNALLVMSYLEAYQITKKEHYSKIAEMTLEYVLRELTNKEGGFYCAQDADSEGVEGKYYVFSQEEIMLVLGEEDGNFFNEYYGITQNGNFEGKSIPNRLAIDMKEVDKHLENERITDLRKKIYDYRLNRTKLHKDDKVLTSWNSIMIVAFAKAYGILGNEKYITAAQKADKYIQKYLTKEDRLSVHYRDGEAVGVGHLDDYAFYSWALIELYEATFDINYLKRAKKYIKVLTEQFFDTENGGFYLYAKDAEELIHRPKELYDGAIPSGNSVAAYALQKLVSYTGSKEIEETAYLQMKYIASNIKDYPSGYCFYMMAAMLSLYPTKELICNIKQKEDKKAVQQLLAKHFLPNVTVLIKDKENASQLEEVADYTKGYELKNDSITFYLCQNHACMAPINDVNKMEELITELK